ncbi:MAG: alpha/beta fold hydrolase [Clostridiales bacterium]|nr:alpha/beta fold hydrolase [Clostridiales bacterium]
MEYRKESRKIVSDIDGLELDLLELIPEGEPKGIFQIHHGMSEYKERYLPFMEYLAEKGYIAVIHDCRGHGKSVKSPEDLGYMYGGGAKALVEDAHQITLELKEKWKGLPVILFGHSMGSMVVRVYTKKYDRDLDMLVVCGSPSKNPALKMGQRIVRIQKKWKGDRHPGKLLEKASFGAFARKFAKEPGNSSWCCSDPEVVAQYDRSPLCGFTFSVDGYEALFELMEECYSREGWECNHPDLPILFIGGSDDPCIGGPRKYARAVQHMRHVGYKKTKGKLYPGMRHEILNEKGKLRVFKDVRKWMEKQMEGL